MRSFVAAAVCSMLSLAFPGATATVTDRPREIELISYDSNRAYSTFSLPCQQYTGCASSATEADESLVFDLQVNAVIDPASSSHIILNGQQLVLSHLDGKTNLTTSIIVEDSLSGVHAVDVAVSGYVHPPELLPVGENATQTLVFNIISIDHRLTHDLRFVVIAQPSSPRRLKMLAKMREPVLIDFSTSDDVPAEVIPDPATPSEPSMGHDQGNFDLTAEVETLSLLQSKAERLHAQIEAKKQIISDHLKEHQDQASLKHLIAECDGLICAAKVVAQRICHKVGAVGSSSFGYSSRHNSRFQDIISLADDRNKPQQASRNFTKTASFSGQAASLQLVTTKNNTNIEYQLIDLVQPTNPFITALEVIATALGLVALFKCIRSHCMSMRKRVERAADKEERRNARAYRRAARRALMRRRWDSFVNTFSCFHATPEPRFENYEEKRALILQDAFLEQLEDLENAEKGDIMEAEIRELRHAQEIVASLVRVDEHRYDFVTPMHDPPPPLVPLPFTPETRSRASTNTLPSYTSESLPDYSSQPETLVDSSTNSVVDGFTTYTPPSSSDRSSDAPFSVSGGRRPRYTPTSSVADVSPRISKETLRTRQSKDSHDR